MPSRPSSPNSEPRPPDDDADDAGGGRPWPGRWPPACRRSPRGRRERRSPAARRSPGELAAGARPSRADPAEHPPAGSSGRNRGWAGHGRGFLLDVHSAVVADRWRSVRRAPRGPWGTCGVPSTRRGLPRRGGPGGRRRSARPAVRRQQDDDRERRSRKSSETIDAAAGRSRRRRGCRRSRSAGEERGRSTRRRAACTRLRPRQRPHRTPDHDHGPGQGDDCR